MYSCKAYYYPQCNAGLHPLYNAKILQYNHESQPRKDGCEGIDVGVPLIEDFYCAVIYTQDDVRQTNYLVITKDDDVWEYRIRRYELFYKIQEEKTLYKNGKDITKEIILKPIKLLIKLYESHDVDENKRLKEELDVMSAKARPNCNYFSVDYGLKCAINPSLPCSLCQHYEVSV